MTTTAFPSPDPGVLKRCAILGTAPSWRLCPWADTTLEVWGLNDGYLLGVPRIDRHYDIHPVYQMAFRQPGEKAPQGSVPTGAYLRPHDHLEWLRSRPFPVYLDQARPDMPTSRTFPKDEILAWFQPHWPYRFTRGQQIVAGTDYEASSPAWMLMHAIVEGYQEIHVYGIHLATQWEYVTQRPNFEWLLGFASGRGIKIVLPEMAPICKAGFQYGFEPKADIPVQDAHHLVEAIKAEGARVHQRRAKLPWWARTRKRDCDAQLQYLDVELLDARNQAGRAQARLM